MRISNIDKSWGFVTLLIPGEEEIYFKINEGFDDFVDSQIIWTDLGDFVYYVKLMIGEVEIFSRDIIVKCVS